MADGGTWTVRGLLEWTAGFFTRKDVDPARLSAELLLSHVLKVPRIKLYTDYERPLSEKDLATFRDLVAGPASRSRLRISPGRLIFSIWNSK